MSGSSRGQRVLLALACACLAACSQQADFGDVPTGSAPTTVTEWQLLKRSGSRLVLRDGSLPYDLNTPLFSDYAHKLRTLWIPEGKAASVSAAGVIEFPAGTVITKTFYYPESEGRLLAEGEDGFDGVALDLDKVRLIETRLLIRREAGWVALPYVWDEAEQQATLSVAGDIKRVSLEHGGESKDFAYVVPTKAECASCHAWDHTAADLRPIGSKVRHLDRMFDYGDGPRPQLETWKDRGFLERAAAVDGFARAADWPPPPNADIDHVARSYLDVNCGHCHNPVGPADTSGLFLHFEETSLRRLGACKQPIAAGRGSGGRAVSILPGDPDGSILHYRMQSTGPAEMMPEIGRSLVHEEGVDLIAKWIRSMDGECIETRGQGAFLTL